jgi:MraZ protein
MTQVDYFERKLDNKRRLTIPTELRDELSNGVVITRGFGNYLHLYPKAVWDEQVEPRLQGDLLDERVADLNIRFRTGKVEASLDRKQGRVMLEQDLLDYAGISKEVIAVSAGLYWRLMSRKQAEAGSSLINN